MHRPGERVPVSGIYAVNHSKFHLNAHREVTCVKGEPFPPCHGCGSGITYTLVRETIHAYRM